MVTKRQSKKTTKATRINDLLESIDAAVYMASQTLSGRVPPPCGWSQHARVDFFLDWAATAAQCLEAELKR